MLDTSNIEVKMNCAVLDNLIYNLDEKSKLTIAVGNMEVSREAIQLGKEKMTLESKFVDEKIQQEPVLKNKVNILDTEHESII